MTCTETCNQAAPPEVEEDEENSTALQQRRSARVSFARNSDTLAGHASHTRYNSTKQQSVILCMLACYACAHIKNYLHTDQMHAGIYGQS